MKEPPEHPAPAARMPWRYHHARRGQAFRHGFRITLGGGAYVGLCLFVGLAAANSQINLLFMVFGIVLGGMLVSGLLSTLTLWRLTVRRQMPTLAMAGQAVLLVYSLTNHKRRLTSYSLHVREYRPPAGCSETYLPAAPAGSAASQRALLLCDRRGLYRFSAMTVFTRFPFSLFVHYARFKAPDEMVVYPAIGRLTHDAISLVLRSRGAANQPLPRRGGEEEFYGLREYRHGDNPRWIHWRRSARLGVLAVREMSPPMPRRLVVIVSVHAEPNAQGRASASESGASRAPATRRDDPLLEKALCLAATLVHDGLRQSFDVGLLATGPAGQETWIPPSRGRQGWIAMMRALALLEPGLTQPLASLPRSRLRPLAGAYCLWITRGLPSGHVEMQVRALAEWNIAVRPLRAEDANIDRLLLLRQGEEQPTARISPQQPGLAGRIG